MDGFDSLVTAIYDAALDVQRWPQALQAIGDDFGGASAILAVHPLAGGLLWHAASRLDPASLATYRARFSTPTTNPYILAAERLPVGEPILGDTIVAPMKFTETPFYKEVLRPDGLRHAVAILLSRDQWTFTGMALLRSTIAGSFAEPELARLRRIAPHLERAVQVTLRTEHLLARSDALTAAVSISRTGALLLDRRGRIAFMNPAATEVVDRRDGLRLEAGRLLIESDAVQTSLDDLLSAPARAGAASPFRAHLLVVPRKSGSHVYHLAVWRLRVRPRAFSADAEYTLVLVADPERDALPPADMIGPLYGLTVSETQVALRLARGIGTKEAAAELGLSPNTVRSHARQVFAKTHTRRQAELVRLLLQFPSVH